MKPAVVLLSSFSPPVHYVGYLASNGAVFMDTRKDKETPEPVVVVAGRSEWRGGGPAGETGGAGGVVRCGCVVWGRAGGGGSGKG